MANRRRIESPFKSEFSLCGDALDAFATGCAPEEFAFAKVGESITCTECCRAIRQIKALRNPLRPRKPLLE